MADQDFFKYPEDAVEDAAREYGISDCEFYPAEESDERIVYENRSKDRIVAKKFGDEWFAS